MLQNLERDLENLQKEWRQHEEYLDRRPTREERESGDPGSRGGPRYQLSKYREAQQGCESVTVNQTQDAHQRVERQMKVLENRLDRALVRFNEALHANKQLREQIDNLRRERGVFDAIYKKLERELQEKKKEMAFIIEVSNIAYEEKDNAITELEQLKLYASKEMDSFKETFSELDELLEEDRKMKETIRARIQERKEKMAVDKAEEKKRVQEGSGKQQAAVHQQQQQADGAMTLQMYDDAFTKIKQATCTEDITKLVTTFMHSEDDNFSLFNYVNELNNETERLEHDRDGLMQEIDDVKGNVRNTADMERQKTLRELETQLKEAEMQNHKYIKALEDTHHILDDIRHHVDVVFARLDCPPDRIVAVCGQGESGGAMAPNNGNLLLYLAAIEIRTDEYLSAWHRREGHNQGGPIQLLRGPAQPFGDGRLQSPEVPGAGEDYADDDEDEGERVMTREELAAKSERRVRQQQQLQHDRGRRGKMQAGGRKQQVSQRMA